MKKNNKRMTKEERRKQILESALDVFIEKGYNGSTTIDIAKEAVISEVTLFRYFDSKKQIFMEAIEPILITSLKESLVGTEDLKPIGKLEYILKNKEVSNNINMNCPLIYVKKDIREMYLIHAIFP